MPKFFPAFLTSFIHSTEENNKNTHIFADFIEDSRQKIAAILFVFGYSVVLLVVFSFVCSPSRRGVRPIRSTPQSLFLPSPGFVTASTNTGATEQRSGVVFFAYRLILRVLSWLWPAMSSMWLKTCLLPAPPLPLHCGMTCVLYILLLVVDDEFRTEDLQCRTLSDVDCTVWF